MSVRFVIGRAGTEKTDWCFAQIVAALRAAPLGLPIYWLLPRQATFQAERDLVCRSGLDGFFRARVLSLEEMAREVLDSAPSTSSGPATSTGSGQASAIVPRITDKGRRLILAHLLRVHQSQLRYFGSVAQYAGMPGQLDAVLSELHRQGTDVIETSEKLNSATDPAPPGLAAKFFDMALLHTEYLRFIGDQRLDPERRMTQAIAAVADSPLLQGATVFIDAFDDYTHFERRFVSAIAKAAADTSITCLMDTGSPLLANPHHVPEEYGIFNRSETAYRSLWFSLKEAAVKVDKPILLGGSRRFAPPEFEGLERSFDEETPGQSAAGMRESANAPVEFLEVHDRRREANLAASRIRDLMISGLRYREIAVLVRDLSACGDLIQSTLAEHGIPCFVDRRRSAAHHPLPRLIRAALAVARSGWPHAAVISALKSGLVDIDPRHADELENYVLAQGIVGTQWMDDEAWDEAMPEVQTARRRLVDILSPLVARVTGSMPRAVNQLARAIIEFLDRASVRPRLALWIDIARKGGRFEQAEEHRQTWAECTELLDELVELMPDVSMPLDEFASILETALDNLDLALAPQTVDQVLVGSIDRTHTPHIAAAIVMGLSEGIFPQPTAPVRILTDPERLALARRDINVDPDTQHIALQERYLGYLAFTRASQRLILIRPRTDSSGRPLRPSSLWLHALTTLGEMAKVVCVTDETSEAIATPRQLVTTLARWTREENALPASSSDARPALYHWLAGRKHPIGGDDPISAIRQFAWKALRYSNTAALAEPTARSLLTLAREDEPMQLRVTPRDITAYRNCRFQHFCKSSLHLSSRSDAALDNRRIAAMYRDVLQETFSELLRGKKDLAEIDDKHLRAAIDRSLDRVAGAKLGSRLRKLPSLVYRVDRVRKTLGDIARSQQEFARAGHFRPALTGVSFGDDATLPPVRVPLSDGIELHISGHIDRIDLGEANEAGVRPAVAIKYTLTAKAPDMAMVFQGRDMELLILLLVLAGAANQIGEGTILPGAALAMPTGRAIQSVDDPDEAKSPDDPAFWLTPKPRGIFDARLIRQFDEKFSSGWSNVIAVYRSKEGNFGHAARCDLATPTEMEALQEHARQCLVQTADQMLRGDIAIQPYMKGTKTPCPQCEFRNVCRIERGHVKYDVLEPIDRSTVLTQLTTIPEP